ncbi:DJ-1/PfpI family protein [Anaeromassilibacillus sp. SJQ-1]|uniref:DJ-1/PfpI family protein n=1 Tax=Anaeromassilibacillus sp. SJQ-1 TaxID=3375419 RepID=UPI00398911FE
MTADIEEKEVTTDDMELVVLPGGMPGTLNLEKSPIVKASVQYCLDNSLYVAAICAAPSILGHMGALKGCTATCFPGFEKELEGASLSSQPVCVSGRIITGKGAGVADGLCSAHCGGALWIAGIRCDQKIHSVSKLTCL